jgi:hypothetical protein
MAHVSYEGPMARGGGRVDDELRRAPRRHFERVLALARLGPVRDELLAGAQLSLADLAWKAGDRDGARVLAGGARDVSRRDQDRAGVAAADAWLRAHPPP